MAKHAALGLYTYAEFGALLVAFLPPMAAAARLHRDDPTRRVPGRWLRRFGRTAARLTPLWTFRVEGEAPADVATRPYVVVANHESNADPFLLSFLPWDMRWVAKEELFRLPVAGRLMRYGGDIALRRGERDSVRIMFEECRRTLDAGLSVMMFPEGTRSRDGELLPFKDGAFELAVDARVPVLPVAIAGTRACMPKGSPWFGRAHAVARVLPAVATRGLGPGDVPALRERVRGELAVAVRELRARLPSPVAGEGASYERRSTLHARRAGALPSEPKASSECPQGAQTRPPLVVRRATLREAPGRSAPRSRAPRGRAARGFAAVGAARVGAGGRRRTAPKPSGVRRRPRSTTPSNRGRSAVCSALRPTNAHRGRARRRSPNDKARSADRPPRRTEPRCGRTA